MRCFISASAQPSAVSWSAPSVHILDFDEMIYGMEVIVHIFEQLHPGTSTPTEGCSLLGTYEQDTRRYFAENTRY